MKFFLTFFSTLLSTAALAWINPEKVYLVVNDNDPDSIGIAQTYCHLRGVPTDNIIVLSFEEKRLITRQAYFEKLEYPLLKRLIKKDAIKAIDSGASDSFGRRLVMATAIDVDFVILCKGVPLYITESKESPTGKKYNKQNTDGASVDSELAACFLPQKNFDSACRNPLYKNYQSEELFKSAQILRVARLDGVSKSHIVNGLRKALAAEKVGVRGRAYIDQSKYARTGDEWLNKAKTILSDMYFDFSESPESPVFHYLDRFDGAAFYFGWYAYKPCGYLSENGMAFADGAVGWHIYSFSANVLDNDVVWSPALVKLGMAMTVGNVEEPFLMMTHHPDLFMEALAAGKSAGEAAYSSIPVLSWQNVVLGDPMYRPFLVTLDEQIKALDEGKFDALSQYVVLRQMNRLARTKNLDEAVAYGKRFVGNMPDIAILYKLLEISAEKNNTAEVVEYAKTILQRNPFEQVEFRGLAMQMANFFAARSDAEAAVGLEVCEKMLDVPMDRDFDRSLLPCVKKILSNHKTLVASEKMQAFISKEEAEIEAEAEAARLKAEQEKAKKSEQK